MPDFVLGLDLLQKSYPDNSQKEYDARHVMTSRLARKKKKKIQWSLLLLYITPRKAFYNFFF